MAVSGLISTVSIDNAKVIELAFRRCRVPPQRISGEMTTVATDELGLLLSDLASHGMKLWTTERVAMGMQAGVTYVDAPAGTLEMKDVNLRTTTRLSGTSSTTSSAYRLDLDAAAVVQVVGFKFTTGGTFDLIIERSDDGSNWTTALDIPSASYTAGGWYWFDIEGAASAADIRVRESTGAAISLSDFYAASAARETPLGVLNRGQYSAMPDKFYAGTPNQYWLDRQRDTTRLHLWPAPNAAAELMQIVGYRERHVMDVGTLTQTLDIPQNWYTPVIDGLAARLAASVQEVDISMKPGLQADAEKSLAIAKLDQRNRSDIIVNVDLRSYTRRV